MLVQFAEEEQWQAANSLLHSSPLCLLILSLSLFDYLCGQAHSMFVFLFSVFLSIHVRLLREVRCSFVSSLLCCTAYLTHVAILFACQNWIHRLKKAHNKKQCESNSYMEAKGLTLVCESLLSESVCLDCRFHMEGLNAIDHVYSKCQSVSIS